MQSLYENNSEIRVIVQVKHLQNLRNDSGLQNKKKIKQ